MRRYRIVVTFRDGSTQVTTCRGLRLARREFRTIRDFTEARRFKVTVEATDHAGRPVDLDPPTKDRASKPFVGW